MKCEIQMSYPEDTIRLTKEDRCNPGRRYSDMTTQSETAQAISLLDRAYQHMRSCLTAALEKNELAHIPVIAIVPADKINEIQEALNK